MMNYEQHGDVALIHLDDGKVNALGHDMIDAINRGLDQAEKEARAAIIMGRQGKFSAGFDLSEFKKGPEATRSLLGKGAQLFFRLFTHPQPLIGACSGHAIAGGAFMLLGCDTRLGAAGDFKIGLNETAIGMTLPVFGIELANARLSKRHLTAAMVQSQMYSPELAVDAGFLDQVVAAEDLKEKSLELAAQLAKLPNDAYVGNKLASREAAIARIKASLG